MLASVQTALNSRRTLAASRGAPELVAKTRSCSLCRVSAARRPAAYCLWARSASTAICGSVRVRRAFSLLVSPVGPHGAPDGGAGRDERVGVRVAEGDTFPAQGPGFLGGMPVARQSAMQADHQGRVHSLHGGLGCIQ